MKVSKFYSSTYLLCYAIVFYIVGAFFLPHQDIKQLKKTGVAKQEICTYTDCDGDEHESENFIELDGVGYVLAYNEVYLSTIPFLVISLILARFAFNESMADREELRFWIYTNSIIGILLIWLTRKPNAVSTILFWGGIIMARFALSKTRRNE